MAQEQSLSVLTPEGCWGRAASLQLPVPSARPVRAFSPWHLPGWSELRASQAVLGDTMCRREQAWVCPQ